MPMETARSKATCDRAPYLAIDSPSPVRTGSGPLTVRWRAADAGAGLLIESAVIDPDTAPRPVTQGERLSLSYGQHRLLVVAVDRAGNAHSQQVVFVVP